MKDFDKDKINNIEKKLYVLELLVIILFSICFTLIWSIIEIFGIYYNLPALFMKFLSFLSIIFLVFYIIIPVYEITRKVGLGCKDIWLEFYEEWMVKTKLGKLKTISAIIIGLGGFYPAYLFVMFTIEFFVK